MAMTFNLLYFFQQPKSRKSCIALIDMLMIEHIVIDIFNRKGLDSVIGRSVRWTHGPNGNVWGVVTLLCMLVEWK